MQIHQNQENSVKSTRVHYAATLKSVFFSLPISLLIVYLLQTIPWYIHRSYTEYETSPELLTVLALLSENKFMVSTPIIDWPSLFRQHLILNSGELITLLWFSKRLFTFHASNDLPVRHVMLSMLPKHLHISCCSHLWLFFALIVLYSYSFIPNPCFGITFLDHLCNMPLKPLNSMTNEHFFVWLVLVFYNISVMFLHTPWPFLWAITKQKMVYLKHSMQLYFTFWCCLLPDHSFKTFHIRHL